MGLIIVGVSLAMNRALGGYGVGFACIGVGIAGLMVAPKIRRRRYAPEVVAARFSYELRKSVFADDQVHEHRILSSEDLPAVDHYFYDTNQAILINNGFQFLGNVENVFLSKKFPHLRTYTRAFSSPDEIVVAGLRHQP
ncbi:MAG TPA: hypothetical protein VGG19_17540, partial [Tepidisphaeraceae bacterium]